MKYILFVCFLVQVAFSVCDMQGQESELLLSFIVNRHGDRTPDPDEIILAEDPELIKQLSYPDGVTALTLEGKRRAFKLGKYFRQRYGTDRNGKRLLSDLYLDDEIAIRSTDLPRTKMTILTALAALYPPVPEQQWDSEMGQIWQPVPYTAVPSPDDYLRFTANCARYKALLAENSDRSSKTEFIAYEDLAVELFNRTGYNFTEKPLLYASLHDLFRSEAAIGIPLPKWSEPLQAKINEAAKLAYDLYMKDDDMKMLSTGVIINNFLKASKDIIAGKPVKQRVRIHTSHDYNVGALMAVSRVKLSNIPDYCSMFALELHRDRNNGRYFVLPVYIRKAGEYNPVTLKIEGCEPHCSFKKFKALTEQYALKEEDYFPQCRKIVCEKNYENIHGINLEQLC